MLQALDKCPPASGSASVSRQRRQCWACGRFVPAIQLELAQRVAGPEAKPLCREHHGEAVAEMAVAGMMGHGA